MKAIKCEMCDSNDVIKQDDIYVCQNCGTKYTLEAAKKLLVEVDNSEKFKNYYILARRAKENDNYEDAAKYYDLIRQEAPYDWEANFYAVYFNAMSCRVNEIYTTAKSISNYISDIFALINDHIDNVADKSKAIGEVCDCSFKISTIMILSASNIHDVRERVMYKRAAFEIKEEIGDIICDYLDKNNEAFLENGVYYLKRIINESKMEYDFFIVHNEDRYKETIRKYEPDYKTPYEIKQEAEAKEKESNMKAADTGTNNDGAGEETVQAENLSDKLSQVVPNIQKKLGCYVATAVYGSYDCPQVWTLRRYRDYTLGKTWYGRAFIHVYYAVSPTLVKWFGKTNWFKNLWKPKLDKMVARLNAEGVEDTPYQDRNW